MKATVETVSAGALRRYTSGWLLKALNCRLREVFNNNKKGLKKQ